MNPSPQPENGSILGEIVRKIRTVNLEHFALFVQIVAHGSLAAAARAQGLSSTTVSERLATLEAHYGARLLNRTTRAIKLTEAGRVLHEGAAQLLAQEHELRARIQTGIESLSGPIRISAPIDFGRQHVAPVVDAFLATHPNVTAELLLVDGYVDLLVDSVDIAVRFGTLADSSLHVRRVGDNRRVVCAAPSYVRQHGTPSTPADLLRHNCLRMRFGRHLDREWPFDDDGRAYVVSVSGDRIANDGDLVRQWCIQGHGIALKSQWDVADDLAQGRLVELLAEFTAADSSLQLVFPPGGSQPRRVREFADALLTALR